MIQNIEELLPSIYEHMRQQLPAECCGVVIVFKGRLKYMPCINLSENPDNFVINPEDYANAEDLGEIVYIVHSHPLTGASPSVTDLVQIEKGDIPWLIVSPNEQYTITKPSGYVLPLIGRRFIHGSIDCYGFIQDYYKQKLNIKLNDHYREDDWWLKGKDYYMEYAKEDGWIEIQPHELKEHDMIYMKQASPVVNHAAIYSGNNTIMHHATNRLSSKEVYGEYYRNTTTNIFRYKDLL